MAGRMLTIRALTPIHSGYGQESGALDQPVVREMITGWPYLNGERIKGVLRDACNNDPDLKDYAKHKDGPFYRLFGPPTSDARDYAGALIFSDAFLLCFPVRSFFGTFAWITCPLALQRWKDDCVALGDAASIPLPSRPPGDGRIFVPNGPLELEESALVGPEGLQSVFLEEFKLQPVQAAQDRDFIRTLAQSIAGRAFAADAWAARFTSRFGIVSDDLFTRLVEAFTIRAARIRLDEESKTVANGALWYEEDVPQQAIFAAPVRLNTRRYAGNDAWQPIETAIAQPIQIGGNKTVGRGFIRLQLAAADGGGQ